MILCVRRSYQHGSLMRLHLGEQNLVVLDVIPHLSCAIPVATDPG